MSNGEVTANSRYCVFCGSRLLGGGRFCAHCGGEQPDQAPENGAAPPSEVAPATASNTASAVAGWRRLQSWSNRATWILAAGAIASGGGPGAIAELLNIKPLVGLGGNLLATAPLVLWLAGTILVFALHERFRWETLQGWGAIAFIGLGGIASLWFATAAGGVPASHLLPTPSQNALLRMLQVPFQVLGVYLEVYGWGRFTMALLGGVSLGVIGWQYVSGTEPRVGAGDDSESARK